MNKEEVLLGEKEESILSRCVKLNEMEGPARSHVRGLIHKLVGWILSQAVKERASDIYFELSETEFMVKYAVDGVLYETIPPPKQLYKAMTEDLEARFGIWGVEKNKDFDEKGIEQERIVRLRKFDYGDVLSARTKVDKKRLNLNLRKIPSIYDDIYHLALHEN